MYRLKRLIAGVSALYFIGSYRLNPPSGSFAPAAETGIDDFLYLGEGCKICRKEEIEGNNHKKHTFYEKKVLPPELMARNVVKLTCESTVEGGICDVYLVGTIHNDQNTWQLTQTVIKFLQPQVVFLELCSDRLYPITQQHDKVPTMGEMVDMICGRKMNFLFEYFLSGFEAKIVGQVGVMQIGGEFRVAYKEAMEYGGKVILGDVPQEVSRRRILAKMSVWRYLFQPMVIPIPEDLLKTATDRLDFFNLWHQELIEKYPALMGPRLLERDLYMSSKLLEVAREHTMVVAVVGMAHLAGIQKNWKQPVDIKQLLDTGTDTFTIGEMLSAIGAMVFYLSLSTSQIHEVKKHVCFIDFLRKSN